MEQPRRKKKKQKKVEQKADREKDDDHDHDHDHGCPPKNEQQDSGRLKKDPAAPKRFKRYVTLFMIRVCVRDLML